jgi:hypothetical protein
MRGGLLRLSENTIQYTGPLEGLNRDGVRTRGRRADGSLWIATTQALNRLTDSSRQSVRHLADARAARRSLGRDVAGTDDFVGRYVGGRLIKERVPDVQASRVNGLTTTATTRSGSVRRSAACCRGSTTCSRRTGSRAKPAASAPASSPIARGACGRASAAGA